MSRRAVITGIGAYTPLGKSAPETMEAMAEGRVAIGPVELRDADRLANPIGAQIRGHDPAQLFTRSEIALYDPMTQYALLAAQEAIAQAGLSLSEEQSLRAGVVIGTGGGGQATLEESYRQVFAEGRARVHPFTVPRLMANAPASHISMRHGLRGPAFAVATACASANHAMGLAAQLIRSGAADVVVTGGTDAMLGFGVMKAWEGLRVMSPDGCRPFCKSRNGMVLGEGAAIFVMEAEAHARARGAEPLAELAGFSMTADASDIVMPEVSGAARAMRGALEDAGLAPEDLGYVNAHGTGTAANDRTESAALHMALGPVAARIPVSSTKSLHGHAMGATGAIEALAALLALRAGVIAPTANLREQDPEIDLDVVAGTAREARVEAAMSNAFAFGGLNAVVVFRALP